MARPERGAKSRLGDGMEQLDVIELHAPGQWLAQEREWEGMRRLITVVVAASMMLALSASIGFAGEITGNGKRPMVVETTPDGHNILHGKSACAFSGLNDEYVLGIPDPEFGRTQNWGQIPKEIRAEAQSFGFNPGVGCNPTRSGGEPPA